MLALSLLLVSVIASISARADDSSLLRPEGGRHGQRAGLDQAEIDDGHYAQSWKDASSYFQRRLTSEKWEDLSKSVRTPLGKCDVRQQLSICRPRRTSRDREERRSAGRGIRGGRIPIRPYENLKHASETVSVYKEADGTWKAASYVIRPEVDAPAASTPA